MAPVNYLWNPINDNIVREFDDSGNAVAEYTTEPDLYGSVLSQYREGQTSHLHFDGIGNTTELTNDAGDVTDRIRYSAFGDLTERTGTTEIPFQYVGQKGYYSEAQTRDYSIRRRSLAAASARWLSVDAISIGLKAGRSRYIYAANSPTMRIDPSGLLCIKVGPAGYTGCGGAQWNAQFVPEKDDLDKLKESGGGFLIQIVCSKYLVELCPSEAAAPLYRHSAPCPEFDRQVTMNPSPDYNCYFEMWVLNAAGEAKFPGRAPVAILDKFQSVGLAEKGKTRGYYAQVGFAYLAFGQKPPDGFDKWKVDETKPPHSLYYRCDEPSGAPQDLVEKGPGRELAFTWDCCCDPPKHPKGETPPSIPPGQPPYIIIGEPYTKVIGECAK